MQGCSLAHHGLHLPPACDDGALAPLVLWAAAGAQVRKEPVAVAAAGIGGSDGRERRLNRLRDPPLARGVLPPVSLGLDRLLLQPEDS